MSNEMERDDSETTEKVAEVMSPTMTRSMTEDYLLQDLVLLAENGVEIGITLLLGGAMVSGVVSGGKRYFEAITENMVSASPAEFKSMFATFFDGYGALYERPIEDRKPATFIHLRDARFWVAGGRVTPASGIWWRGRIDQIGGFHFGTPGE